MLTKTDIERAKRLCPTGFEFVDWESETFTKAYLSCFSQNSKITVIIGAAGSGKSVIYKMLASSFGDKALCVAPTGVAANNVSIDGNNAHTIHNAFGFNVKPFYDDSEFCAKAIYALSGKRVLLIDEVSMVSSNLLDFILKHVELVNQNRHSSESRIHTVLFGDPLQLRPILPSDKMKPILDEQPELKERWDFFNSEKLKSSNPDVFVLDAIYRQNNAEFKAILNRIRIGEPSDSDIEYLNKRIGKTNDAVIICSTNQEVDAVNQINIDELSSYEVPFEYKAEYSLGEKIRDCGFSDNLELFTGEKVMCTRNVYDASGNFIFQNGTIGVITSFEKGDNGEPVPVVETDDGRAFKVERMEFSDGEFRKNPETHKLEYVDIARASQIPLKPCYAITYHKSQGLTLSKAYLKMPSFAQPGLIYMGLSRVRSLEDLTLSGKLTKAMFKTYKPAQHFIEENSIKRN